MYFFSPDFFSTVSRSIPVSSFLPFYFASPVYEKLWSPGALQQTTKLLEVKHSYENTQENSESNFINNLNI